MNMKFYFFIGFALFRLDIPACRGDSACPNESVTPYSVEKLSTDSPSLPIPSESAEVPSQMQKPSTECPNFPVPSKTITSTIPPQIVGLEKQSNFLCPTILVCCLQNKNSNSCGCQVIVQNSFKNNSSVTTTYPTSQCCSPSVCQCPAAVDCRINPEIVTTPSPSLSEPTQSPPPASLFKCPPGTQLLEKRCHLLYCPRGSQMINDRCISIECPVGTVWTGHRCTVPDPIVQNVTVYNTIITKFNQTKPDIILNNTNNIIVKATLDLDVDIKYNNNCNYEHGDCDNNASSAERTLAPSIRCCEVKTPRICEQRNNRWRCYSRRYRRCGDFCIAPIIYLKPSRVYSRLQYLVMPPIRNDCKSKRNCAPPRRAYDCSGCILNNMERCSHYCYRYVCPPRRCGFYDQEKYCASNVGVYECQEENGCFGSWCL